MATHTNDWCCLYRRGIALSERAAQFVFEHVSVPAAEIEASAVPSRGAVGLLKWVQSAPANQTAFYATIWMKLMPTKSQLDAEARYSDDDGIRSIELLVTVWSRCLATKRKKCRVCQKTLGLAKFDKNKAGHPDECKGVPGDDAVEEKYGLDATGVHGDVRTTGGVRPDYPDAT